MKRGGAFQDSLHRPRITQAGIDHEMETMTVGPFDAEILLDEIDALAINGIHELLGFLLAFAASQEAADFILSGSVKKDTQGVWTAPEKVLGPSPDDDRISGLSGVLNDAFGNLQDGFAVNHIQLVGIEAAFVTSTEKGLEETVVQWISAFLTNLHDGFRAIRQPGDLLGEQLIPKLPAKLGRERLSDFASPASILPFHCDDLDHVVSAPASTSEPGSSL